MVVRRVPNAPASSAPRARHRRPAQPRRKAVTVSVVTLISASLALWRAAPYLRRIGVPVPHVQLPSPLPWAIALVVIAFVGVEVFLLARAVTNIRIPDVYGRYCELMFTWPYALVAPYVFTLTRAVPNRFFSGEEEEPEPDSEPTVAEPEAVPTTVEEWRDAFRLLMSQISSVQMDRDIQDVIIKELRSLIPQDLDSGRRRSEPVRRTGPSRDTGVRGGLNADESDDHSSSARGLSSSAGD